MASLKSASELLNKTTNKDDSEKKSCSQLSISAIERIERLITDYSQMVEG